LNYQYKWIPLRRSGEIRSGLPTHQRNQIFSTLKSMLSLDHDLF